jgi:hypothetical protein
MNLGIILLGLIGLVIVLALMYVVTRIAREREAAGRRKDAVADDQQRISPLSSDSVSHLGHS